MGIRTAILLAFIPVFLVLGLLSTAIEYILVEKELRWGLYEQSTSVGVGIAAFLDRNTPGDNDRRYAQRLRALTNVMPQGDILAIELIDLTTGKPVQQWGGASGANLNLNDSVKSRLQAGEHVLDEPSGTGRAMVMESIFPVHNAQGIVSAGLRVLLDGRSLSHGLEELKSALILRVVLIVAVSLPVGWLFGWQLTRKLLQTRARCSNIVQNPAAHCTYETGIRELDDVNEALEILAALLEEQRELITIESHSEVKSVRSGSASLTSSHSHSSEAKA